jgi:Flp pilus assembly protein TadD
MHPKTLRAGFAGRAGFALVASLLAAGCASNPQLTTRIDAERLRLADAAESAGDRDGVVAFLSVAAARDSDPALQMRYATALADAGRGPEAVRVAERARLAHDDDRALAREVGRLCVRLQDGAAGARAFQAILVHAPQDAEALDGLGLSYVLEGRLSAARDSFGLALRQDPSNIPARNNLALADVLAGEPAKAIDLLRSADLSAGAPTRPRHTLALAYAATGEIARAKALLEPELGRRDSARLVASYGQLSASGAKALDRVELWNHSTSRGEMGAEVARASLR